jgi:hypothetical protein
VGSFYFTLLAVLISGLGARDQMTVAGLSLRQGARPGVLVVGLVVSVVTASFAAWAAALIAPVMAPRARLFLSALALALAGGESLLIVSRNRTKEPTRSLGALAIVLLSYQLTDAARFLVFAIAVATDAPAPAGIAGALGGAALLGGAWFSPQEVSRPVLVVLRRGLGAAMIVLALYLGLHAIGRV